jgi:hypothetical protein
MSVPKKAHRPAGRLNDKAAVLAAAAKEAFQRPFAEGVEIIHAVQNVFLDPGVTIA